MCVQGTDSSPAWTHLSPVPSSPGVRSPVTGPHSTQDPILGSAQGVNRTGREYLCASWIPKADAWTQHMQGRPIRNHLSAASIARNSIQFTCPFSSHTYDSSCKGGWHQAIPLALSQGDTSQRGDPYTLPAQAQRAFSGVQKKVQGVSSESYPVTWSVTEHSQ